MAIFHEDECYELGKKAAEARNRGDLDAAEAYVAEFRQLRRSLGEPGDAGRISLNNCYQKGYADHRSEI